MADFSKAFRTTIVRNEGGYNPGIGEKETYRGIDRGANPNWPGWSIIDSCKRQQPGFTVKLMDAMLAGNHVLQANIVMFYKTNYWDVLKLDQVTDQQLANNLFDCSVNQGEHLARRFMQVACNYVIAATGSLLKPITIDQWIGPVTLMTFNALPAKLLMSELNAEREASYRQDRQFAKWGKVWQKRLLTYT